MEFIDTHSHLTYDNFAGQIELVIARAKDVGVCRIITVGTDYTDSQAAVKLAGEYENIYAAVGIHPHEAENFSIKDVEKYSEFTDKDRVLAIGETGLDYYYDHSPRLQQKEIFQAQLELARKHSLPAIIHCRDAFEDCLSILRDFGPEPDTIIFHCYSGDPEITRQVLDLGCLLSFAGTVTFKKAPEIQASAVYAPLDRIMVETDSPYLSPAPKRSIKPNEPALVVHTAAKIAELKNVDLKTVAQVTTQNCRKYLMKDYD